MKSRLMAAIGVAALAAVAGCGSSSGSSASSNGKVTLTFFGADYGTGPSNSTTKYWDAIATAFHQAHPNITVNVQTVNWTDFPTKSATLIQNKQYPDIMEGNPAPPYAPQPPPACCLAPLPRRRRPRHHTPPTPTHEGPPERGE